MMSVYEFVVNVCTYEELTVIMKKELSVIMKNIPLKSMGYSSL